MEIKYKNTNEKSLDCLLHCVTTTSNFNTGVKRKITNISIVLAIAFLFILDKAVGKKTNTILWVLSALVGLFIVVFIIGYKKYYINKCKKKMSKNLTETIDTPEGERTVVVNGSDIYIGISDNARKYPLINVKETYDYDDHFCIIMKNGSVACIPNEYLSNKNKKELEEALEKRFDIEDDTVVYDTPF